MKPTPSLAHLPRSATRRSGDGVWPLRDAAGRTWAERKQQEQETKQ